MERVRVRDDSKNEFTTTKVFAESVGLKVLDKPAVDDWGRDVPTKYHVTAAELNTKTVPQLQDHAARTGVDLGEATKKDDIIAAIAADTKEN